VKCYSKGLVAGWRVNVSKCRKTVKLRHILMKFRVLLICSGVSSDMEKVCSIMF